MALAYNFIVFPFQCLIFQLSGYKISSKGYRKRWMGCADSRESWGYCSERSTRILCMAGTTLKGEIDELFGYKATRPAGVRSQGFPSAIGYEMHLKEPLLWQQLEAALEQVPKIEEASGTSQFCRLFSYILQLHLKSL